MGLVHTLVAFVIALGVLIFFHELGHYLVARWSGVKILRFSVGFGRPLWIRRFGPDQTEWAIAALPLGGFVRMLDEREGQVEPHELHRAFNRQNVWKRIAIVAAGPIANFLLAIVVYAGMFMHGVPEQRPVLGPPATSSIAARAGVTAGDLVQRVSGVTVQTSEDFRYEILEQAVAKRTTITLDVLDARQAPAQRVLEVGDLGMDTAEIDPITKIGLTLHRPSIPAVIGIVEGGGAAEAGGLKPDDHVVAIDGRNVDTWDDFVDIVSASAGREIAMAVVRGSERVTIRVTPREAMRNGVPVGRIGAGVNARPELHSYGPVAALGKAVVKTWDMSVFSLRMLGKMVTGNLSWRHLSGPVTIADVTGKAAKAGIIPYLTIIAIVSISLGVLNLLPIPVLDGGHLLYYAAELVKGRPLSERTMELGQRFGLAILLCLMVFAFYNDINRLFSG